MFLKILLTILFASQLSPALNTGGQILGWQTTVQEQQAGDSLISQTPQRINKNNLGLKISPKPAIIVDKNSSQILWSKNPDEKRSIASITKLMTVLVFLSTTPDLKKEIALTADDITSGSKLNVFLGEKIHLENLLNLALVNSDNNATLALVRATGFSEQEFVKKMNDVANKNNLNQTFFSDPIGLANGNVSTAIETARLLALASNNELIKKILAQKNYSFTSLSGRAHSVKSTNSLLNSYLDVIMGKTGYTEDALYCFTSLIKLKNNAEVITVVLGASSNEARFQDTKVMAEWVQNNYQW